MSGMGEPQYDFGTQETEGSQGIPPGQETNPDSLANPFLAKIPEGDREIVGKYIKDWDSGVTKRFQQIHQEYAPYKSLGADPEALSSAWALKQLIDEDPQRVYDLLGQVLQGGEQQGGQQQIQGMEDLPAPFVEKFTRMEQILEQLAGRFMQSEQQQQASQEDAQLEEYLTGLRSEHGDFDEQWVLSRMMQGVDGEKAVQEYNAWLQEQINSRMSPKRPVPVLGGGGAVPTNGVDPRKLSRQQTQDLVAKMLEDAAAQGQ